MTIPTLTPASTPTPTPTPTPTSTPTPSLASCQLATKAAPPGTQTQQSNASGDVQRVEENAIEKVIQVETAKEELTQLKTAKDELTQLKTATEKLTQLETVTEEFTQLETAREMSSTARLLETARELAPIVETALDEPEAPRHSLEPNNLALEGLEGVGEEKKDLYFLQDGGAKKAMDTQDSDDDSPEPAIEESHFDEVNVEDEEDIESPNYPVAVFTGRALEDEAEIKGGDYPVAIVTERAIEDEEEAEEFVRAQNNIDQLADETDNFSFWANSSGMVNSTNYLTTTTNSEVAEVNPSERTSKSTSRSDANPPNISKYSSVWADTSVAFLAEFESSEKVLELDQYPAVDPDSEIVKIEVEVDVIPEEEEETIHIEDDDEEEIWKKKLSPDEMMREELAKEERMLQEEQNRARQAKENLKIRQAELKRKKEEFKISERKRLEEKVKREREEREEERRRREEEARVRVEVRKHEIELQRLQEVEARRAAHEQKVAEERERRERMQEEKWRRQEDERRKEDERQERERAKQEAKARSGKLSRRDMHRSLNRGSGAAGEGAGEQNIAKRPSTEPIVQLAAKRQKSYSDLAMKPQKSMTDFMNIDSEIDSLGEVEVLQSSQKEMQELGQRAWGSKLKSSQLRAQTRLKAELAKQAEFMSVDGDMEALGRDYPEVEVLPRGRRQEQELVARGRSRGSKEEVGSRDRSRREVHTLYPPLITQPFASLTSYGNRDIKPSHVQNPQNLQKVKNFGKPPKPPASPGTAPKALPNLAKFGLGISIKKVVVPPPRPNPMLLPQIARITRNSSLNVSITK